MLRWAFKGYIKIYGVSLFIPDIEIQVMAYPEEFVKRKIKERVQYLVEKLMEENIVEISGKYDAEKIGREYELRIKVFKL